jgi:ATP-dependent DNA helicase DinG
LEVATDVTAPRTDVEEILGPGGSVSRHLAGYEPRPQQIAMSEAVADAIATKTHLVVEAPTGVGKSLGYLVPAILEAVASGTKVVVSTKTISLQEQLIRKDLPFLQSVMPVPFDAVLLKGRGNYLSLRRLVSAIDRREDLFPEFSDEGEQLARLAAWSDETETGDTSDLDFRPKPAVWDEVRSDADNCMGRKCPMHAECFYYRSRRRVAAAPPTSSSSTTAST